MSEPRPELWRPPGDTRKADDGDDQKVFDTVVGPNFRLIDNLIQLATIVVGTAVGVGVGVVYAGTSGNDPWTAGFLGGFAGLLLSLLLSGFVIGVVRAILAMNR